MTEPSFAVRAQYLKDISFENPNSPHSLMPRNTAPRLSVTVDVHAKQYSEDAFEVVLHVHAKAEAVEDEAEAQVLFLAEVHYAGLFSIQGLPQEQIEPLLFINCPHLLFPFMRQVVANATREGGFPPLMLEPIDFHRLYADRKIQEQAA